MLLKVMLPTRVLLDQKVKKVVAEAQNGSFGLLPHHIDFVAALPPSIVSYEEQDGTERYFGIDEGILVKRGAEVVLSALNAVSGDDLHNLRKKIRAEFIELDERQRSARSALARLEAGVVRRFIELQQSM